MKTPATYQGILWDALAYNRKCVLLLMSLGLQNLSDEFLGVISLKGAALNLKAHQQSDFSGDQGSKPL
jgi:hypothetical protein